MKKKKKKITQLTDKKAQLKFKKALNDILDVIETSKNETIPFQVYIILLEFNEKIKKGLQQ